MYNLYDSKNQLRFCVPEVEDIYLGNQIYNKEDDGIVTQLQKHINGINSPEITKYVLGPDFKFGLGEFVKQVSAMRNFHQCYVFEKDKLVATFIFSKHRSVYCEHNMFSALQKGDDKARLNEPIANGNNYIDYRSIRRYVLNNLGFNNTMVDYLVVLPEYQGRGIGTRIVSSITRNPEFFGGIVPTNAMLTCIAGDNIPSQKVFNRNGFGLVEREKSEDQTFRDYVCVL